MENKIAAGAAIVSALMAVIAAYSSYQSAAAAKETVAQHRVVWQEELIQKFEDRWNSLQMQKTRLAANSLRTKDREAARRHLRTVLDFFDGASHYVVTGMMPAERLDSSLGYAMWGYYQIWQEDIAHIDQQNRLVWDDFQYFIKWKKGTEEQDFSPDERRDFVEDEITLLK